MYLDSYSKARYVAQLVQQGEDLQSIQRRIGDRHVPRLGSTAHTCCGNSYGPGCRTSQIAVPPLSPHRSPPSRQAHLGFSGVSYRQQFHGCHNQTRSALTATSRLPDGDKEAGRSAAIKESRDIKDLAQALASESGRAKLESGASAEEAVEAIPAVEARLERLLRRATDSLLGALELTQKGTANRAIHDLASQCLELARRISDRLKGS